MNCSAKKTDKLELRLTSATKRAFVDRCEAEGHSTSEAVRCLIEGYVAQPSAAPAARLRLPTVGVGVLALLIGIGLVALAGAEARHAQARLGLVVFLAVEALLFAGVALTIFCRRWCSMGMVFGSLALVQLTWTAQANPPAPFWGTINGLFFGGFGPTLVLAAIVAGCWMIERRSRLLA